MIYLDAPKGFGDAIYLRAVVLYFLDKNEQVTVYTLWPKVFLGLPINVRPLAEKFASGELRSVAYSSRMPLPVRDGLSDQFQARCVTAGITEPVKLRIDWVVRNKVLVKDIQHRADGRKIFIYQPPKLCKNRQMDLLKPKSFSFARFIAGAKSDEYFRIRMGHSQYVETNGHTNYELDLLDKLKVTDVLDVCTVGDVFFGEECYLTHIAEALDRQVICMLSRRAALSKEWVRHRTMERMFNKPHLASVVYDEAA